ncbi:MAG: gamma-glutamyl-gamma-aminobutyrate hydrolase family protein [Nocardioidaceae bacterium]
MALPVIGLSTYREEASWGVWSQRADLLHHEYADSVVTAGGVPVLLPPAAADDAHADAVVGRLDGLVICGGADVDPARYGEDPHPRTAGWRPDRDAWEVALLRAAERAALPVLGVCRGMQLMAAVAGGRLDQHTPDTVGHTGHGPAPGEFGSTRVTTQPGSRVAGLVGDSFDVPCHHHQSVLEHPGFEVTARADDGTVEAMERPGDRFCLAIQWHPEKGTDLALFHGLVEAARHRMATSA